MKDSFDHLGDFLRDRRDKGIDERCRGATTLLRYHVRMYVSLLAANVDAYVRFDEDSMT